MKPSVFTRIAAVAAVCLATVLTPAAEQKIYWGDEVPSGWSGTWPAELQTVPERTKFTRTVSSTELLEYIAALKTKA